MAWQLHEDNPFTLGDEFVDGDDDFEGEGVIEFSILDTLKARQGVCEDEKVFTDRKLYDAQRE